MNRPCASFTTATSPRAMSRSSHRRTVTESPLRNNGYIQPPSTRSVTEAPTGFRSNTCASFSSGGSAKDPPLDESAGGRVLAEGQSMNAWLQGQSSGARQQLSLRGLSRGRAVGLREDRCGCLGCSDGGDLL